MLVTKLVKLLEEISMCPRELCVSMCVSGGLALRFQMPMTFPISFLCLVLTDGDVSS